MRSAPATSRPSGAGQRREPQDHRHDGRQQPAVAVVGVLRRVREVDRLAHRVRERGLLGAGVGRALLGTLGQTAAQRLGSVVRRARHSSSRSRCRRPGSSPAAEVACGAADQLPGGGVDARGTTGHRGGTRGQLRRAGAQPAAGAVEGLRPACDAAARRRPGRRLRRRRRSWHGRRPWVPRASTREAESHFARTGLHPGEVPAEAGEPPAAAHASSRSRRSSATDCGARREPRGATVDDATAPRATWPARPAKSRPAWPAPGCCSRAGRRRGAACGRPATAPTPRGRPRRTRCGRTRCLTAAPRSRRRPGPGSRPGSRPGVELGGTVRELLGAVRELTTRWRRPSGWTGRSG